jgi:hypothetical protein
MLAEKFKHINKAISLLTTAALMKFSFPTLESYAQAEPWVVNEELVWIYRDLLQMAAVDPVSESNAIFSKPPILTEEDINKATEEMRTILYNPSNAKASERVLLLRKIDMKFPLSTSEKNHILHELFLLQNAAHTEIDIEERREFFVRGEVTAAAAMAVSTGLTLAGVYTTIPVTADPGINHLVTWGIYGALASLGGLGAIHTLYWGHSASPESYRGLKTWQNQLIQWGPKIDAELYKSFDPRRGYNTAVFPALPFYSALLNRAAAHLFEGSTEPPSQRRDPPALTGPSSDSVAVSIHSPVVPRFSIRNLGLKDADFNGMDSTVFSQHVREFCEEMKRQPYAIWNQIVLRRLFFLALTREDTGAIAILMHTSIKDLGHIFVPQFEKVFLLGVSQDNFEITRYFLRRNDHHRLPNLSPRILARAKELAERGNQTQMVRLISDFIEGQQAHPSEPDHIRQTASHDRDTERATQSALTLLRRRYRQKYIETFPENPFTEASILPMISRKIDSLRAKKKLSTVQTTAAKGLLARIEEPFNPASPDYDPTHMFLWNTPEKKKLTKHLMKIAYLALEDDTAYKENTGKMMTAQDLDDNWEAWILNALYDGEHAYNLDQGRHPDRMRYRPLSSCVAGVDHRIIHGLTGIHPDVKITAGSSEKENLLTWNRAQTRFKEEKKAHFYNSVFDHLIDEWAQKKAPLKPEARPRISHARVVPVTTSVDLISRADYIKDYQAYVTERAQAQFGAEILKSDEIKTLLETIQDNPDRILSALQAVGVTPH